MTTQIIGADYQGGGAARTDEGGTLRPEQFQPTGDATTGGTAEPATRTTALSQATEQMGATVGDIADQQAHGQQLTYALGANNQYELQARQMLDEAKRSPDAANGITDGVQANITKLQGQMLQGVDSIPLRDMMQQWMRRSDNSIMAQANEFDFRQRDQNIQNNFNQSLDDGKKILQTLPPDQVQDFVKDKIAQATAVANEAAIYPATRDKMIQDARNQYGMYGSYVEIDNGGAKNWLAHNNPDSVADGALNFIVRKNEGGFNPSDGSTGMPSLYGITQKYFPDEFAEAQKITATKGAEAGQQYAIDFYKKNIWEKNNLDALPPQQALIVADSLINQGSFGQKVAQAARSGASSEDLLNMRRDEYTRLAKADPDTYEPSLHGWLNRMDSLQQVLPDFGMAPPHDPKETGIPASVIPGSPAFRAMDFDAQQKVVQYAQAQQVQQEKEQQQQEAAQAAATKADFDIRISRGEVTQKDLDDAYAQGIYKPGEYSAATQRLDKQKEDAKIQLEATRQVNQALSGSGFIDTTDKNQLAAANETYSGIVGNQANMAGKTPDQVQDLKLNLASRMGFIPDDLMAEIKGGMASPDMDKRQAAINTILSMQKEYPMLASKIPQANADEAINIKDQMDRGADIKTAYANYVAAVNMPQATKDFRGADFDKKYAGTDPTATIQGQSAIAAYINQKTGLMAPLGVPPEAKAEFMKTWRENYMLTGNPDAAEKTALQQVQKVWGPSSVGTLPLQAKLANSFFMVGNSALGPASVGKAILNYTGVTAPEGQARMMRYAPEKFYGVAGGIDNSKWMNEQLADDVDQHGQLLGGMKPDASKLMISPTFNMRNGKPTYQVQMLNNNGEIETVYDKTNKPMEWFPDWASSKEKDRAARRTDYYQKGVDAISTIGTISRENPEFIP